MKGLSREDAKNIIKENNLKTMDDVSNMFKNMHTLILEEMLQAEMDEHLGYKKHDYQNKSTDNTRNGKSSKKVKSEYGNIKINIPRDRNSDFEPTIVKKGSRDISGLEDKVISLYAKGLSVRDIETHLEEIYDIEVSPGLISNITDRIMPEISEWQNRPLESIYPIVYLDGIHYNVRQDGAVINKAVHVVIGVDLNGKKDILGLWISTGGESSKFWLTVLNELKNRGLNDILIACTDNLKGFSDAIKAVYPHTEIQKCIIHQIRNSTRYISHKDKKEFCKDLKNVYRAVNEKVALDELSVLDDKWGKKYPLSINSWQNNWEELSTFFKYPEEVRRVIYTTNAIESFNRKLRKVTKIKGSFPTDDSLMKMLYLATKETVKKWTTSMRGWSTIISQFSIYFEERLSEYLY